MSVVLNPFTGELELIPSISSSSSTLADVSSASTDATKSLYTMSSAVPVEFKTSDAHSLLYLDETNERVGIGTNTPSQALTLNGAVQLIQTSDISFLSSNATLGYYVNNQVYLQGGNGGLTLAGDSGRDVTIAMTSTAGGTISFTTGGGLQRMSIANDGKVAISTSLAVNPAAGSPTGSLYVDAGNGGVAMIVKNTSSLGAGYGVEIYAGSTSADHGLYVTNYNGSGPPFIVQGDGKVGVANVSPGALLDIGTAGSILGTLRLEGNTSGYVQIQSAAAAGSWTLTLPTTDGNSGEFLQTNGSGVTTWASAGGGSPASPDTSIQFNDSGSFGGSADLTWDGSELTLGAGKFLHFEPGNTEIRVNDAPGNGTGNSLDILAGSGSGSGGGSDLTLYAGYAGGSGNGNGGALNLNAGGGAGDGNGGDIILKPGDYPGGLGLAGQVLVGTLNRTYNQYFQFENSSNGFGGFYVQAADQTNADTKGDDLVITAGRGKGTGAGGNLYLGGGYNESGSAEASVVISGPNSNAILNTSSLASSDKTFTFPNQSGSFVITNGHARATAQTAANTNILTQAVGAADGTFQVLTNVLVTTSTAHSFTVTVDYTDESNTSRTLTIPVAQLAGTLITAITNVTGAGPYEGVALTIRAKASTNIVFKTAGTFTTVTYSVDASIIQVA